MSRSGENRRFSEIVKRYGVSDSDLKDAMEYMHRNHEVVLGHVLVFLGSATEESMSMAIAHHRVANSKKGDPEQAGKAIDEAASHTRKASDSFIEYSNKVVSLFSLAGTS